jgi:hypothetical protein
LLAISGYKLAGVERVLTPAQKKLLEDRRKAAHAAEAKPSPSPSRPTAPAAKEKRREHDL